MNLISVLLCLTLSLSAFSLTLDEERKYDELEGLPFLRALSADKKFDEVVRQARSISPATMDRGEYGFLIADAHMNLKQYEQTLKVLEKFQGAKKKPAQYEALWARALSRTKKYESCADHFGHMNESAIVPADWSVFFSCLLKANRAAAAVKLALREDLQSLDFILQSQKTLISHALHGLAQERREQILATCHPVDFYLRLWAVVAKLPKPDLQVLEKGHACHPKAMEISSHLVKAFFTEGHYHSIAFLFQELSAEDRLYLKHTAEFYKVAGRSLVADYFFLQGEEQDYLLARSSNFLNQENYAALLTIPLRPTLVASNKDLAYALAYSHFKFLSLDASRSALGNGTKSGRGQQLAGLIDHCRELGWRCRP